MKRLAIVLTVCSALSAALLPAAALAGGQFQSPREFHSHGAFHMHSGVRLHGGFQGGRGFVGRKGHHGRFAPVFSGHFSHKFHHRPFISWFPSTVFLYPPPVVYSTPLVSSPPVIYSAPTLYSSPSVVYSQQAPIAAPPPAVPPMPTVVQYSTGRYELRGDGVTTPYAWVWIPNPPPAPPAAPPPSPEEPLAESAPPASRSKIYRWTDEEGTTFWTNNLENMPEPY